MCTVIAVGLKWYRCLYSEHLIAPFIVLATMVGSGAHATTAQRILPPLSLKLNILAKMIVLNPKESNNLKTNGYSIIL